MMNIIENTILKDELKYKNSVVLKYKIGYPQITQSNYELGKQAFNRYNKNKAYKLEQYARTAIYNNAKEFYDYNHANGNLKMFYELNLKPNITYNKNYIVSLYYDQYEFTGGAHGSTIRTSQTWDLRTGKQFELSYFFHNNQYYIIKILKNINSQIKDQISSGNGFYFDDYYQLILDTFRLENYYITENGIVVYFQQYDIAPYSSGIPEFVIN